MLTNCEAVINVDGTILLYGHDNDSHSRSTSLGSNNTDAMVLCL